ncbi:MAG: hypothetical protein EAZ13_05365 [Sphingobacteriia bacterium]|jgi:hypothetical protein|nr:MAG: hypothetical protein EAZ13_05365 [Sphingobacteriia bacterium]
MYKYRKLDHLEWFKSSHPSTNLIPKNAIHFILTFLLKQMLADRKVTGLKRQAKHPNFLFNYYKAFQIHKRLLNSGKICINR